MKIKVSFKLEMKLVLNIYFVLYHTWHNELNACTIGL